MLLTTLQSKVSQEKLKYIVIMLFFSGYASPPPIGFDKVVEKVIVDASVNSALLNNSLPVRQPRYGSSEFKQFFIILSRALLFSRRDWVSFFIKNNSKQIYCFVLLDFDVPAIICSYSCRVFNWGLIF